MKKLSQVLTMLVCLAILLTVCRGPSETTSTASSASSDSGSSVASQGGESNTENVSGKQDKDSITYAVNAEPGNLDPQNNGILPGMMMERQIYDPLIDKDPETGELIPGLATEWEWLDETHLSLTLREGVKWHDGSDFTAEDVLFTLSRFPTGSATGSLYTAFDPENSTSDGDYQVTIAFKEPFAPALNFLTNGRAYIVSKAYCEANGEDILDRNPMGTGAYIFQEWVVGNNVTMVRNDNYWGTKAQIKNLTIRFIAEETARMIALEAGEVDIAAEPGSDDTTRALNGEVEGVIGYTVPSYKVWYLAMNQSFESFQDARVRLALAHAVDWEAACEVAGGITVEPAQSCIASTIFGYEPQGIYEYDPELSKQLLAEAGYADGFEVTCVEEEVPVAVRMLETMQAYLADVGITMNIEVVDTATWNETRMNGTAEMTVGNMTAMTGDPMHTLSGTVTSSVNVIDMITDERYNELYEQGASEMDETARAEIYAELQAYVYENAFQIPMYQQVITYAVRDYVEGFVPDAGLQLEFKYMSIA